MMPWIAAFLLLAGSALCLLAAIGVLRLPDFFMRMHAATKAGVAGCGLVLAGVAAFDGSLETATKVGIAIAFLLLTTPVAGHLLGRAAYVSGVPLWAGTTEDELQGVLMRGRFDAPAVGSGIRRVVLALAEGSRADAAIDQAIAMARQHGVELCGVAVIDVPRLANVGPVPIGAGWHAQQMRERRIRQARQAAANVIQRFESRAREAGIVWSVMLEEGRPGTVLRPFGEDRATLLAVAAGGWFDQGVLDLRVDVGRRLARAGVPAVKVLG